jgi:hypothetical protein
VIAVRGHKGRHLSSAGGQVRHSSRGYEEAVKHHFSTAGLPVVPDGMSAVLRARLAVQMRVFHKIYKRNTAIENDVIIAATALERARLCSAR